ncbi:hypothetical protein NDU88_004429 [Pleurodeles waltl]|uniref:Uncharacterized protein n=1 Tax=Pleurodeles waltl TaxID=8319 RepID=A0AAV7SIX9_PLEWA|nr:hypothetical protein NDU88_004429 [Pleurodeles waltl]
MDTRAARLLSNQQMVGIERLHAVTTLCTVAPTRACFAATLKTKALATHCMSFTEKTRKLRSLTAWLGVEGGYHEPLLLSPPRKARFYTQNKALQLF